MTPTVISTTSTLTFGPVVVQHELSRSGLGDAMLLLWLAFAFWFLCRPRR